MKRRSPVNSSRRVLGQELGPVIFELNYAEAIRLGVLPPFDIVHYGLALDATGKRPIRQAEPGDHRASTQEFERPGRKGLGLIRWCRSKAPGPSARPPV